MNSHSMVLDSILVRRRRIELLCVHMRNSDSRPLGYGWIPASTKNGGKEGGRAGVWSIAESAQAMGLPVNFGDRSTEEHFALLLLD